MCVKIILHIHLNNLLYNLRCAVALYSAKTMVYFIHVNIYMCNMYTALYSSLAFFDIHFANVFFSLLIKYTFLFLVDEFAQLRHKHIETYLILFITLDENSDYYLYHMVFIIYYNIMYTSL